MAQCCQALVDTHSVKTGTRHTRPVLCSHLAHHGAGLRVGHVLGLGFGSILGPPGFLQVDVPDLPADNCTC